MFRYYYYSYYVIIVNRDILLTLTKDDLTKLEKALCANDSHSFFNARDTKQQHHCILQPITVSNIRTVLVPNNGIENETSEHGNETDDKNGNESGTEQWRENVSINIIAYLNDLYMYTAD